MVKNRLNHRQGKRESEIDRKKQRWTYMYILKEERKRLTERERDG